MATKATGSPPVVFLGPSLPRKEAETILAARYLPPAAQGSVIAAVLEHSPSAVVLVDGVFQGEPAVRHKEILWALSRGIPVFGAASMGALRAAELWPHGMVGVGLIYRWYRRFPLLADDAVAVLHGPDELGAMPLTTALVDLRRTFRRAERERVVDAGLARKLLDAAVSLNFRQRTLRNAIGEALGPDSNIADIEELAAHLDRSTVRQKAEDAKAALSLVAALIREDRLVAPAAAKFVVTTTFLRDLDHSGIRPT